MQGELLPQLCFFVTPSRPAVPPSRTQLCPANSEKEHLVICGHVDSGKSTTTGRLIFELACFPERKLEKLKQEAKRLDKGSFAFAFHNMSLLATTQPQDLAPNVITYNASIGACDEG